MEVDLRPINFYNGRPASTKQKKGDGRQAIALVYNDFLTNDKVVRHPSVT